LAIVLLQQQEQVFPYQKKEKQGNDKNTYTHKNTKELYTTCTKRVKLSTLQPLLYIPKLTNY